MSEDARRSDDKPEHLDRAAGLWRRVNEHKLVQWSVAYVAVAYAIQHGVILTAESLEWPALIARATMLLLIFGLPLIMVLAWYHGHHASRSVSKAEASIIALLLAASSLWFYVFINPHEQTAATTPAVQEAGVAQARRAATDPHSAISLVVLPFANLSADKDQEFFSDGMTDELASALAKVPDLRVVGRSSAFQFKGQNRDLKAVGDTLHASHIIEGSVRKSGNRVRITAQLTEAGNGLQVWTDSFDRELTDVFAIQEDIARAITSSLRVPLGLKQGDTLVRDRTTDADSYEKYLRAKALVRARGTEGLKALTDAAALLELVVASDPAFAPAWALLAQAYALTPSNSPMIDNGTDDEYRHIVDAFLPRAEAAAQRAIQLGPNEADGYVSLGTVYQIRQKFVLAEELYSKALALDPNNPDGLNQESIMLANVGRPKEAFTLRQKLYALEPFVPRFNQLLADTLWLNGQTEAAIALENKSGARPLRLAWFHASAGRFKEAADALSTISPETFRPGVLQTAVRLLRTAPQTVASSKSLPSLGNLGFVYLYIGAPDRILDYFEGLAKAGGGGVNVYLLQHPSYAPVRKTERFKTFVRNAGLVDYWKARGWPEFCHPTTGDDFACD